jgi:hypothetical protein
MEIMFNGLDKSFELSNLRYGRETRKVFCFAKHHSLTIYIYIERESKDTASLNSRSPSVSLTQKIYQIISEF